MADCRIAWPTSRTERKLNDHRFCDAVHSRRYILCWWARKPKLPILITLPTGHSQQIVIQQLIHHVMVCTFTALYRMLRQQNHTKYEILGPKMTFLIKHIELLNAGRNNYVWLAQSLSNIELQCCLYVINVDAFWFGNDASIKTLVWYSSVLVRLCVCDAV